MTKHSNLASSESEFMEALNEIVAGAIAAAPEGFEPSEEFIEKVAESLATLPIGGTLEVLFDSDAIKVIVETPSYTLD
jgi:hypothetical protein